MRDEHFLDSRALVPIIFKYLCRERDCVRQDDPEMINRVRAVAQETSYREAWRSKPAGALQTAFSSPCFTIRWEELSLVR